MARTPLAIGVVFACLAAAAQVAAAEVDKHFHQSFEVAPGARLNLNHGDGDVVVTPWDQDLLDVDVRYRATVKTVGYSSRGDFDVDFRQSGSEIHVIGREPGGLSIGFHSERHHEYRYTVRAPAWLELNLTGDDGGVTIEGWEGPIESSLSDGDARLVDISSEKTRLSLDDGDARIERLEGELIVRLSDGDIQLRDSFVSRGELRLDDGDVFLEGCAGDFDIETSDGGIELRRQGDGRLRLRADDGDIELALVGAGPPDVEIETGDGMIVIELPASSPASFELQTDDGEVKLRLPESAQVDRGKRRAAGRVDGGAGRIRVRSEEGDITLRVADH